MRATAIEKGGSMRAADTVFLHGHVITVNEKDEIAEAVAVSGNQICMVGTSEEVQAAIGAETKVIDLRGRTLMPGFIDAHMHLTLLAQSGQGRFPRGPGSSAGDMNRASSWIKGTPRQRT